MGEGYHQGLTFRRNFAEISVFFSVSASYRDLKFRYFSIYFVSKFNKFRPKSTEIYRNLPKFRNEISFPLNTGISSENEMVNPGYKSLFVRQHNATYENSLIVPLAKVDMHADCMSSEIESRITKSYHWPLGTRGGDRGAAGAWPHMIPKFTLQI